MTMVSHTRSIGFTLIELVMVLIVLSAISIFVIPRFTQQSSFASNAFHQELKTAIRYAHKLSIASGCEVQVNLTANSYSLYYPNDADGNPNTCDAPGAFGSNPIQHPTQPGNYTGNTPNGVTITGFGNFYFGTSGEPNNAGNITVNPDNRQITLHPLTGFAQ